MPGGTLVAGGVSLRRAQPRDLEAVLALQQAAYARNRALLGCEPLPLLADYQQIFRDHEVWLAGADSPAGVLILEPRPNDLLIWSIATDPAGQGGGLGKALLSAAEVRARELKRDTIRLYTGATLQHLIDWYGRHGYRVALGRTRRPADTRLVKSKIFCWFGLTWRRTLSRLRDQQPTGCSSLSSQK